MLKLLLAHGAIVDTTQGKTARYYAKTSPEMTQTLHHAQLKQYIATKPHTLFAASALKAVVKGKADITTLAEHRTTLHKDENLKEIYKYLKKR